MNSFEFKNPTKIVFGENCIVKMARELAPYGKNILLTYGGGSIKKNKIYDAVIEQLKEAGKEVFEMPGIMANPRLDKVYEGVELCHKHNIDLIVAVGGGSTVDCSKAIAAAAKLPQGSDVWETLFVKRTPVTEAIPIFAVLTMAATGSEMNGNAVITNWEKQLKYGMYSPAVYPQVSFLDPTYTYSLPKEHLAYGIVDMMSHLMESYFSTPDETNITDDLIEQLLRSIIANGAKAIENPKDYVARSNIMWAATLALNGLTGLGKASDWMTHQIEHALSAYYDIPHGAGLAICHPMLLTYIHKDHLPRFTQFAKNVFHISPEGKSDEELALAGLQALRQFFHSIGAPITLKEVHIPEERLPEIAASCRTFPTSYHKLTIDDILAIYKSALD